MCKKPEINDSALFDIFGPEHDRFEFPADVHRVTAGNGGEALLIFGREKTALYDCGMAYCGEYLMKNIRGKLNEKGRKTLDYVILSHSHYDHIGALPYIRRDFPEAVVCGSQKCHDILERPNARKLMKELGTAARDLFMPGNQEEILVDDLSVDKVLIDGDIIDLGEESIIAMETKGHTDCSMTYMLKPVNLLFASESTGLMEGPEYVHTPFLKSYSDAMISVQKCMDCGAEYLCLSHFGMIPKDFNSRYWELLHKSCDDKMSFIRVMSAEGLSDEEMLQRYTEKYWNPDMDDIQPIDAFLINAENIIKAFLKAA